MGLSAPSVPVTRDQANFLADPIMKIYKDVFSGDELFSDTYPMKLVDDCIYEVYGKHETRTEGEVKLAGSNASAEGEDAGEGSDPNAVSGIDIVLNHRLNETGFGSKKDYTVYLKDYMKKVVKYLEDNERAGEVDTFKKNINGYMKEMLGKFKDLSFFCRRVDGQRRDHHALRLQG